ncbi:hypothetical protein P43SY_011961 [Pythium insidiosum]|uniref:Uncharacterized protein n=1 Tax=Pythium insidiosum TaxID=114742 RepID=A0AAD5L7S3_PYTIN|nr:hypothetical protein P43SY_011961 [Pythium insidiosum]
MVTADHEEPLRIQFSGCAHRFVEALSGRNQVGFQLHHYAGVSWEVPDPWDQPAYTPAPLDERFMGAPGPDFYLDSFPAGLLEAFDRRVRSIRELLRLTGASEKMRAVGGDDPLVKLRRHLLTHLVVDDAKAPAPAPAPATSASAPAAPVS